MLLDFTLRLRRLTDRWRVAQWATFALALVLCLSTTGVGLAAGVLLAVFAFRGDFQKLRWHWRAPLVLSIAAFLALFPLGVLWSDAPLPDMLDHFEHYLKLLFIPMITLVVARGRWPERVLLAAFASLLVLLSLSLLHFYWPEASFWPDKPMFRGVPFGTYFLMNIGCAVAAHGLLLFAIRRMASCRRLAIGAIVLAALLVSHLLFITPSRTGVLVLLSLVGLLFWQTMGWKGALAGFVAVSLLAGAVYMGVPQIRDRFDVIDTEIQNSLDSGQVTSSGVRYELLRVGLSLISQRPVFGHGTGSLWSRYEAASRDSKISEALITDDPHNQFVAVMIPFGILGLVGLIALWAAPLRIFWGTGFYACMGQAVVLQSVVSSFFNSSIQMFELGWFYVVLTGVLAAAVWRDGRHALKSS